MNGDYDKLRLQYSYGDWVSTSIDATKNNGNIVQQVITVPDSPGEDDDFTATQKYYYDSLNRIDDATETVDSTQTWRQDFSYDRYGNRSLVEANTTTIPKSCLEGETPVVCTADHKVYNPSANTSDNRLSSSDDYVYDAAGNMIIDAQQRRFIYDGENKQVEVSDQWSVVSGQYWYDGDGKRVKKVVPDTGEVTIFVYDAAGKQIAEYSTIVADTNDAKVAYLTNDHLGSPRINTDADGDVTARHDYHPFGEEISTAERTAHDKYTPDSVRKQFTGYERDKETDLDFAEARIHSHNLGRFLSPDPLYIERKRMSDPQNLNLYLYVGNRPLKHVDPEGMDVKVLGSSVDDYVTELDNATPSFATAFNSKTKKVEIVGADGKALSNQQLQSLGKTLSGTEKELFNAITDTKNHVTINTTTKNAKIFFGAFEGNGKQTLDFTDINLLNSPSNSGGFSAAQAVAHETIEAYAGVTGGKGLSKEDAYTYAHNYANQIPGAGGLSDVPNSTVSGPVDAKGRISGATANFNVIGKPGVTIRVTFKFETPIPKKSLPKPANVTKVEKLQ